jgi:hypothetical protein
MATALALNAVTAPDMMVLTSVVEPVTAPRIAGTNVVRTIVDR